MIPLESRTSSAPLCMKELREQLVFHDHLLAAVTHWKSQIIAELKSDQNIIFIGVHCRNEKKTTGVILKKILCRRTDYAHHYKTLYRGSLVDHNHFDKAFQVYR